MVWGWDVDLEACNSFLSWIAQSHFWASKSFTDETCARSTVRGSFDWRVDWVNEVRDKKQVVLQHVYGDCNHADIMTKCLKGPEFRWRRNAIVDCGRQPKWWVKIVQDRVMFLEVWIVDFRIFKFSSFGLARVLISSTVYSAWVAVVLVVV